MTCPIEISRKGLETGPVTPGQTHPNQVEPRVV